MEYNIKWNGRTIDNVGRHHLRGCVMDGSETGPRSLSFAFADCSWSIPSLFPFDRFLIPTGYTLSQIIIFIDDACENEKFVSEVRKRLTYYERRRATRGMLWKQNSTARET